MSFTCERGVRDITVFFSSFCFLFDLGLCEGLGDQKSKGNALVMSRMYTIRAHSALIAAAAIAVADTVSEHRT